MNVMTKCSLCDQEFDTSDPLIEVRKHRHVQGMHTAHIIYSERDGSPSKDVLNVLKFLHLFLHLQTIEGDTVQINVEWLTEQ